MTEKLFAVVLCTSGVQPDGRVETTIQGSNQDAYLHTTCRTHAMDQVEEVLLQNKQQMFNIALRRMRGMTLHR